MTRLQIWIKAFRPSTLPLAMSCVVMGSLLAHGRHAFSRQVLLLALLTALLLQILSNLANDYGDAQHGVDGVKRLGPQRVTQLGLITGRQMRRMIALFAGLALSSGTWLTVSALRGGGPRPMLVFFALGGAAIAAAVLYTVGKKPYGYIGLGDLAVFIFFGIVGVAGTFFLHTRRFDPWVLLPSASIGFFSTAVLNINNMRDIDNDSATGKITLAARMGIEAARYYHAFLVSLGLLCGLAYAIRNHDGSPYRFLFVVMTPFFGRHIVTVFRKPEPARLNVELKRLALATFVFAIVYGLGIAVR